MTPAPGALLMLARELRDAAVIARRQDVAAKAEEAITLITSADSATGRTAKADNKSDTVVRILDGLGF